MRLFVTGATGVVGRRAVPLLLSQGHSVTAGVRQTASRVGVAQKELDYVPVDLFDLRELRRAVAGHDAIINLATQMPSSAWNIMSRSSWRENDRIRTEGVANLVEAARRNGISRFVQESFALTYPDRADAWIDEQTPIDPAAYSKTVSDAERSVADFCAQGYTGVVLRFAAFYGPDAMQVKSYIDGLRWGWALLPGGPDRFISSISHDDAASAVVAALEASQGIYNVADDQPVRRARYFELLASNLGLKSPNFVPEWATPMFGSVGQAMSRSLRLSNAKLRGATRWRPRFPSVREGWPAMLRDMGYGPAAPGR